MSVLPRTSEMSYLLRLDRDIRRAQKDGSVLKSYDQAMEQVLGPDSDGPKVKGYWKAQRLDSTRQRDDPKLPRVRDETVAQRERRETSHAVGSGLGDVADEAIRASTMYVVPKSGSNRALRLEAEQLKRDEERVRVLRAELSRRAAIHADEWEAERLEKQRQAEARAEQVGEKIGEVIVGVRKTIRKLKPGD